MIDLPRPFTLGIRRRLSTPGHIRPLLDRLPGGRVLVTTRRATGWHDVTAIRLDVFNPNEALDLGTRILTHHGSRTTDSADTVCAELGHLALAVKQAAAYCAETGTNPHDYLDMLVQWPATMFATSATSTDPKRTIARIWRLTPNHLTDTPLAGSLLRILAWYAPDNIPRDLLHNLAEPPQLAPVIGRLTPYSMITANHDGILTIYRLRQALARTPDSDDPHHTPEAVSHARDQAAALLAETLPPTPATPRPGPGCRALLPHTDTLTRHHTPDHDTTHTARALDRAAAYWAGLPRPRHDAAAAGHLRARRRQRRGRAPDTTRGGAIVAAALSAGGGLG
ncbi:hypothetical protein ABZS79_29745 [Streptomyces griseoloalbus]|uniref:hypothetical protein n=1 Tax=Streptomyces griseoloalbus TaxID=67303 RepID=UPI0033AD61F6